MYKLAQLGVIRLADGANIPAKDGNRDWQAYQEWLAAGNTPLPADPEPTPIDLSNVDNLERALKALALVVADVSGRTPLQIKQLFKQKWDLLS